jgi:hypothetical protein
MSELSKRYKCDVRPSRHIFFEKRKSIRGEGKEEGARKQERPER